jgi:cell division transport system permease protein
MKPAFFVKEAFRSISRNAIPSFAAMASVLVTVLVLGVFIPIVQATTGAANEVRGRVLVDVYLKTDAKQPDIARVRALLQDKSKVPHVGKVEFVSKAKAYAQEKARNPEAYQLLGTNPLPDTFRVTPDKPDNAPALRNELTHAGGSGPATRAAPIDPAIDQVKNRKDETAKILTATRVVKLAMAALAILLVIASVLLISNTIRLSLFSRRREVEVMKLVGATDSFIRWPFVIEGVVLGALGGIIAVLLLAVGKIALLDPLASDFALIAAPRTIGFGLLAGLLLVASVAVSAAGSGISLRKFLRV